MATDDGGTDAPTAADDHVVVDAAADAAIHARVLAEGTRRERPLVQLLPAAAEGCIDGLVGPCGVPVERDREAVDTYAANQTASTLKRAFLMF